MKLAISTFLLAISSVGAFTAPAVKNPCFAQVSALAMSSPAVEAEPFTKGPRIIRDELPITYVYDHCPFCVRVRLALGVKNIKHNVQFLANDDIPTPTKLIGKKIAPIFVSIMQFFSLVSIVPSSVKSNVALLYKMLYFEKKEL
mmetsp:Transcript_6492/g.9519  ORF Transcript_6492/g.9519 Transcript_6492/m.9519 type:complete len:144 (+) Transcript_6492:136-567(+)